MRKNKPNIEALKREWKIGKDFNMLTIGQQIRFIWWIITSNPRGIFFLVEQVKFGKNSIVAYSSALSNKDTIIIKLTKMGYYNYPNLL